MAHEIVIPRLGWSMEEGTFVGWLKKEGEFVKRGEALFELEGEKATQEIEAVDEGVLHLNADSPKPGTVLKVGAVIGVLAAKNESHAVSTTPSRSDETPRAESSLPPPASPAVRRLARTLDVPLSSVSGTGRGGRILSEDVQRARTKDAAGSRESDAQSGGRSQESAVFASPRARRVAAELGVDWRTLTGSGSTGRVREQDVRMAAASTSQVVGRANGQRIQISNRRKVIAKRMMHSRSQTVPVTITRRTDATNLVGLREQFKTISTGTNSNGAVVPSYQDIITKLVGEILKQHLVIAGRWDEDAIVLPSEDGIHIGMAVDVGDGLLVPVLRDVCGTSLLELAKRSKHLVDQARLDKLTAADMQGSVFTITNLGSFGIEAFTPVINSPETAILGLGAIIREAIVLDDGAFAARSMMTLSLTFDHRVVDGAPAARFLQDLNKAIENPSAWLLK